MLSEEEQAYQAKMKQLMQMYEQLPISYKLNLVGEVQYLKDANKSKRIIGEEVETETSSEKLYQNLTFRAENYIEKIDPKQVISEKYDIILCLSTIKWIQLNWGDLRGNSIINP